MKLSTISRHLLAFSTKTFQKQTASRLPLYEASRSLSLNSNYGIEKRITGHNIELNGQHMHFKRAGWGPKTVLLMPGALGTSTTDFAGQLNEMDGSKYSLIAWDPPGHGDSRPPEKEIFKFFWKDAEKAAELMAYLGISRYSLLGWSDGGITAMILASNYGVENVEKLVIWGSNAYFCNEDYEMIVKIRDVKKTWSKAFRERFEPIYGEEGLQKLWGGLVDYYLTLTNICVSDLPKIKADTLILHGDKDPLVAPQHPGFLHANIPNAQIRRFENGRHDIHINPKSAPDFNRIVDQFLSK